MKEATLSTDDFSKPKVLKDHDAVYTLIVRLLLLEPGSIQGEPEMGIGLLSNYRFADEDKIDDLKEDLDHQLTTYLPDFQSIETKIYLEDSILRIQVTIDGILFSFEVNESSEGLKLSSLT